MININEQKHKEAYEALLAVSTKYGIDFVTILDEDIFGAIETAKRNGVEGTDEMLAKLTPEVCKNIRDEFNERLCEAWADCLEDAINNQINSDDADADSDANSADNEVKD